MRLLLTSLLLTGALASTAPGIAQESPVAFTGAHLIPVVGPDILDGVLVVHEGKILAIGAADTAIPDDATQIDLAGKVLMPGLIDTHSHIGQPWAGDSSGPLHPDVRSLDAIDVRDGLIQRAQAGGITVANLMPGSGHLMSGQTTYLKLRDGNTIDELLLRDADGKGMGGMKMANGTNSQRATPFPGTRGKSAALVRELFVKAQAYGAKIEAAGDDASKLPERDLEMEALQEVLSGERVVHHHTHRHDDIVTVLRLSKEFGFRVVLQHASEAWKVADEIAAAGAPASVILIDAPGGKLEAVDMNWKTAGVLEKAGVTVAMHTDDAILDSRLFPRSAALAHRAGLSRQGAIESITLAGAKMLDIEARAGSLEVGKDADLAIFSGDPLSVYSIVEQTWVDGSKVFDLSDPEDRLYATGGWGGSDKASGTGWMCCYGDIQ